MNDRSGRKDLLFYSIILGFAAVACFVAFSYPGSSSAFPRVLCIGMVCIAALSFIGVLRNRQTESDCGKREGFPRQDGDGTGKMSVVIFIMTGLYILALSTIGFFVSTSVFLFLVMYVLNYRNKPILLGWPLILSGILWLIFCSFLKVPTPDGFLF